jgi:hypothetical protein
VALLLSGCALGLLEWRLPPDALGLGFNLTRLSPLVILAVIVPAILAWQHRRGHRPSWSRTAPAEVLAGLCGYFLTFHLLHRNQPRPAGVWDSWWVTALGFVTIWLVSVGVAAICTAAIRLLQKPRLEPRCARCGYALIGLRDDRCPECGNPALLGEDGERTGRG